MFIIFVFIFLFSFKDIIASICHHYGIPHILFDVEKEECLDAKKQKSMTINIYPNLMILSKALADIVHSYSWRTFSVIYDTDEGMFVVKYIYFFKF